MHWFCICHKDGIGGIYKLVVANFPILEETFNLILNMIIQNYKLLKKIEQRPGMWAGENTLKSIKTFLAGYNHALFENNLIEEGTDLFFDWIAKKLGFYESTAGWANMILAVSLGFEPKKIDWAKVLETKVTREQHEESVRKFYSLLEEFIVEVQNKKV